MPRVNSLREAQRLSDTGASSFTRKQGQQGGADASAHTTDSSPAVRVMDANPLAFIAQAGVSSAASSRHTE